MQSAVHSASQPSCKTCPICDAAMLQCLHVDVVNSSTRQLSDMTSTTCNRTPVIVTVVESGELKHCLNHIYHMPNLPKGTLSYRDPGLPMPTLLLAHSDRRGLRCSAKTNRPEWQVLHYLIEFGSLADLRPRVMHHSGPLSKAGTSTGIVFSALSYLMDRSLPKSAAL